jgi:cytochrome c553
VRAACAGAFGAAAIAAGVLLVAVPAHAQQKPPERKTQKPAAQKPAAPTVDYAQKYAQVCAACHGPDGRSDMQGVPLLAGQPSFYAITQLFLFREGRRKNEAMTAIAKPMTDDDLRGYSDFIGTLPPAPPAAPATPPDAARMSRGQALATQHKCVFCHGAELDGGQQVPRIAGQKEDYLRSALHGFKQGQRPGYTMAMTEAVSQVTLEELDILAYYAAHFAAKAAAPAGSAPKR